MAESSLARYSGTPRAVAPGTYQLVFAGADAGLAPAREVVIVAGEETAIAIEIQPPPR